MKPLSCRRSPRPAFDRSGLLVGGINGEKDMKAQLLVGLAAFASLAGVAVAGDDINTANGLAVTTRLWNDFGTSILNVDGTPRLQTTENYAKAGYGSWNVNEKFDAGTVGNYANKHIAYLSNNGGTSAMGLHSSQSWKIDLDIKISAPNGAPRKEGAIQIDNPRPGLGYTDEGRILVASDGEVAVFGGVMPFTGFGNVYTRNTTAHISFEFYAPGTVDAVLGAYRLIFTDAVTGVHDSGIKLWGASEPDGTKGFNEDTRLALVVQNQRNPFISDESDFMFSNITLVPAPGSLALMGFMGLAASRRRR